VTVSNEFRVEVRPYSGHVEPWLPTGSYIAEGGSIGDASGGSVFMNFLFAKEPDPRQSEMYNIEQMAMDVTPIGGVVRALFRTLQMDNLAPTRIASPQKWQVELGTDLVDEHALNLSFLAGLPLWLGAPSAATDCGVRFEFDNLDGTLYAVTIQGFIWGPRSVLAPGGPQRPLGGRFG